VRNGILADVVLIATAISIFSIFVMLFDFGSRTIAPIHLARGSMLEVRELLNLNWYATLVILGLNFMTALILIFVFNCNLGVIGIAISMSLEKSIESIIALSITEKDLKFLAKLVAVRKVIPFLIYPLALFIGMEPTMAFVILTLSGALLGSALALVWLGEQQLRHKISSTNLKRILKKNAHISISSVLNNYTLLDIPLIFFIVSSTASGSAAVVSKLTSPFNLFNELIIQNLKPILANASAGQILKIRNILAAYFLLTSFVSLIIVFNSERLIAKIFGEKYLFSSGVLVSIMAFLPFVLLNNQLNSIMLSFGKYKEQLVQSCIYAIGSIATAILLGIKYGTVGVIIGLYCLFILRAIVSFFRVKSILLSIPVAENK
jgi:O-antigen/teichoic acid export membrane protein